MCWRQTEILDNVTCTFTEWRLSADGHGLPGLSAYSSSQSGQVFSDLEFVVVAVDVGRTLGEEGAKEVLRIARSIVTHKVLYGGKNDSVCVVLFGAASTRNALHDEMDSEGRAHTSAPPQAIRAAAAPPAQ